MKKLFIFDLDGTLVNSLEDLADAVSRGLLNMGYPIHTLDEYKGFVGDGASLLCKRSLPAEAATDEKIEELYSLFAEHYAIHYADKTRLYDGIAELLKTLKENGALLAVASNKPHFDCERVVKSLSGEDMFDVILGNRAGIPRKPAPDIILAIMDSLGVSAEETLVVGDSSVDVLTARNAGVECCGCLWGFRDRDNLESAGVTYIAERPSDILNFIG